MHPVAAVRSRAGLHRAAVQGRPLAHPDQTVPRARPPTATAPRPSSQTSTSTNPPSTRTQTVTEAGPACLSTLVSASCTIRYAERSTPAGRDATSPATCSSTGSPAARTESTRSPSPRRLGCGVTAPWPALVSRPSSRRISAMPCRPAVSIEVSACWARSGRASSERCAACDWMTIIPMLCATRSCSSRAMRARSSATARAACSAPSRSAVSARSSSCAVSCRRCRIQRPRPHVPARTNQAGSTSSTGSPAASFGMSTVSTMAATAAAPTRASRSPACAATA